MKHLYRLVLLLLLLGTGSLPSYGQQSGEALVTGNFQALRMEPFVRQLEAQTGYRFYYDSAEVKQVAVTLQVQAQPLASVLRQAFAGTELRFALDENKRVFITTGTALPLLLPSDFFRPGAGGVAVGPATGDAPAATGATGAAASPSRLYEIGRPGGSGSGKATLAGHVREAKTGEPVPGASV